MPDLITIGETMAAFSPEGGLPIRKAPCFHLRIAGAESNTAIGVARLGHTAGWISRLGKDSFGEYILNTIHQEGVDTSRVTTDTLHSSGIMFKQPNNEDATEVSYYRENSAATYLSKTDIDLDYLKSAKVLHITGITPILSEDCNEYINAAIEIAHANHILVSFDPNIRLKLWQDKFHYILIDEFQDTNFLGYLLIQTLIGDNIVISLKLECSISTSLTASNQLFLVDIRDFDLVVIVFAFM